MTESAEFQLPALRAAADVETWHPDLETLVRYGVPFICFDRDASAIHISPGANTHFVRHRSADRTLSALRTAAREALALSQQPANSPTPRVVQRVSDPADGSFWAVHVVRTRHDWTIAIAVRDDAQQSVPDQRKRARLTQRELEVAALVAEGARSKSVAESLAISVHTARRHTEHVYRKLGVHTRSELTKLVHTGWSEHQYASGA